jgi:hypothetical protein
LGFSPDAALASAATGKLDVPILVARDEDGLLYPTPLCFTYTIPPSNQPPITIMEQLGGVQKQEHDDSAPGPGLIIMPSTSITSSTSSTTPLKGGNGNNAVVAGGNCGNYNRYILYIFFLWIIFNFIFLLKFSCKLELDGDNKIPIF